MLTPRSFKKSLTSDSSLSPNNPSVSWPYIAMNTLFLCLIALTALAHEAEVTFEKVTAADGTKCGLLLIDILGTNEHWTVNLRQNTETISGK